MGNRRRIPTMILLYLALSLLSLPLCSSSNCSEAVQEVCQEVITENNDQLLETMGEMVANRSCDNSNMIQKEHFDQLYQKIANLISVSNPLHTTELPDTNIQTEVTPTTIVRVPEDGYFKQLLKLAKTCDDLARCGLTESGEYELDPDGPMYGDEPIRVFCNFTTNATVIIPDTNEINLQNCESGSGCASVNVSYEVNMNQIMSIVDSSTYCQQELIFSCNMSPLVLDGESFSTWKYRNGRNQSFTQDNAQCECNDDGTCLDATVPCNCYSKLRLPLKDTIRITDRRKLPMTGFAYGPFTSADAQAAVTFKNLECFGGLPMPYIARDNCGVVSFLNGRWLQFYMGYYIGDSAYVSSKKAIDCYAEIKFPWKVNLRLTVANFQSEYNADYLEIYEGPMAEKARLKEITGSVGRIVHEWQGEVVVLRWKTQKTTIVGLGSTLMLSSMTAYVSF